VLAVKFSQAQDLYLLILIYLDICLQPSADTL